MSVKSQVTHLVHQWIADSECFLVDLHVNPANKIQIQIDHPAGLKIDDCVSLSRHIENNLDREKEDFELTVSSPGAESAFKVSEQYTKHRGRTVQILLHNGLVTKAILDEITPDGIKISPAPAKRPGKEKVAIPGFIPFSDIKETKAIITFNSIK